MKFQMLIITLCLVAFPLSTAAQPMVFASTHLESSKVTSLHETFLPQSWREGELNFPTDAVQWTWWAWDGEPEDSWPSDDANYRASLLDLTVDENLSEPLHVHHTISQPNLVEVEGEVLILGEDINEQYIVFDLRITPRVDLSNQSIVYLSLQENYASDSFHRHASHLVRELRPEVGFSLKANNTTASQYTISFEHLSAAGVDLAAEPLGWTYSLALFGNPADEKNSSLLAIYSGPLPHEDTRIQWNDSWVSIVMLMIGIIFCFVIINNTLERERGIPKVNASWSNVHEHVVDMTIQAAKKSCKVVKWDIDLPYEFRGRPPTIQINAGGTQDIDIRLKQCMTEPVHLYVHLEIEELGGWRQHVWLHPRYSHQDDANH